MLQLQFMLYMIITLIGLSLVNVMTGVGWYALVSDAARAAIFIRCDRRESKETSEDVITPTYRDCAVNHEN